ncbi:hypothetical protein D3C71_1768950 [compost metagenome]
MRRRFNRFLIFRSKGTQRVLHAIPELAQHVIGNVGWVLRDKIDAHTFGTDQTNHLFDFIQQNLWGVAEQQMRFVKEEHNLGFLQIARFR